MVSSNDDVLSILKRSLSQLNSGKLLKPYLSEINTDKDISIVAIGKAAWPMARTASDLLGRRIKQGFVLTKYNHSEGDIPGFTIYEAGHPIPDENSVAATREIVSYLKGLDEDDHLIMLISGGGSALLELPREGVTLDQIIEKNQELLKSGASIEEINRVRKTLSRVKGGGLADIAEPASIEAYVLSDVLSNDFGSIASGPVYLDNDPEKYKHTIIGDSYLLLKRVADEFIASGFDVIVSKDKLVGASREEGVNFAYKLLKLGCNSSKQQKPIALIAGGETVVEVKGNGKGGRCQEFALAASKVIKGSYNVSVYAIGSDGTDGPTDIAGAVVNGQSYDLLRQVGVDIDKVISQNDSYHALKKIEALIKTGPTGTNVNDVYIGIISNKKESCF